MSLMPLHLIFLIAAYRSPSLDISPSPSLIPFIQGFGPTIIPQLMNLKDEGGCTPLHLAILNGHVACAKLLIKVPLPLLHISSIIQQ